MSRIAWEHQKKAVEQAKFLDWYALFHGVGSGKTYTAIQMTKDKAQGLGRIPKTIVFTVPRTISNWKSEFLENSQLPKNKIILLQGTGKKRKELFAKECVDGQGKIFVCNYETLLMEDLFTLMLMWKPEVLIFDESHKLKNPTARRSKLAFELSNPWDKINKKALPRPFVFLLTGSAILNSPMDIFQQFKIMDGGKNFGLNFFAFRARYFRDRNASMPKDRYFPKWEPMTKEKDNFDAVGEINKIIWDNGSVVKTDDCIDMPPEVVIPVKIPLGADQKRLYTELKKDLITFFDSKACTASLAITKSLRLRQIVTGFLATESGDDHEQVLHRLPDNPRIEMFKSLLEELIEQDQKVLVWAVFKQNYVDLVAACDEVRRKMKYDFKVVQVHGGISDSGQELAVKTFQSNRDCRVFIGHPRSGGIGLNLVEAGCDISYSRDFSLENEIQSRGRNRRGGSLEAGHKKIIRYNFMAENTIDEIVDETLKNKGMISAETLKLRLMQEGEKDLLANDNFE